MTASQFTRATGQRSGAGAHEDMFESALRGYDRRQVDDKIGSLQSKIAAADADKQKVVDRLGHESERADQAEKRLQDALKQVEQLSQQQGGSDQSSGFGQRAERLLRMAENEAAEARATAANEAATILEDVRGEAEAHRHKVEQELISRATLQDHEASRRSAALQEREQEIANERAAARQETEEMREIANREAERVLQDADAKAADVRKQAEKFADQQRDAALREVDRLTGMRTGVRSELARLHQYLGHELTEDADDDAADQAGQAG